MITFILGCGVCLTRVERAREMGMPDSIKFANWRKKMFRSLSRTRIRASRRTSLRFVALWTEIAMGKYPMSRNCVAAARSLSASITPVEMSPGARLTLYSNWAMVEFY